MNAKTKEPEVLESEGNELTTVATITPMQLLEKATAQGADVGQLTALMDLQERWEAGEAQKAYIAAMSLFQADCPIIEKMSDGHNSRYANLPDTLKQIKELMKTHGFVHSWKTDQINSDITVTCCVTHKGGHKEFASLSAAPDKTGNKNDVQAVGSTNTYLQRYTLFSVLGLASAEQDDDANSAFSHEAISIDQETAIIALLEETGIDQAKFLVWAKAETVGDILERIPAAVDDGRGHPMAVRGVRLLMPGDGIKSSESAAVRPPHDVDPRRVRDPVGDQLVDDRVKVGDVRVGRGRADVSVVAVVLGSVLWIEGRPVEVARLRRDDHKTGVAGIVCEVECRHLPAQRSRIVNRCRVPARSRNPHDQRPARWGHGSRWQRLTSISSHAVVVDPGLGRTIVIRRPAEAQPAVAGDAHRLVAGRVDPENRRIQERIGRQQVDARQVRRTHRRRDLDHRSRRNESF